MADYRTIVLPTIFPKALEKVLYDRLNHAL